MLAVSHPPSHAPFQSSKDVDEGRSLFIARGKGVGGIEQLLASPVQFVEGSSTGILAVPEGKYEPINAAKPLSASPGFSNSSPSASSIPQEPKKVRHEVDCLYSEPMQYHYPHSLGTRIATGLLNMGNTCFLNSVLQALLHLPPLMNVLLAHTCYVSQCAACSLRQVMEQLYSNKRHFIPSLILNSLNSIAKHLRRGRQEDAHEFLRYLIEALQKSCISHLPTPLDHKLAETTWVHQIFGGRLRSRVKCRECGHPSDTFDSMLDLSIDVHGVRSLKEALHKFVKLDILKGADSYKCEKCKKPVIAEKGFTIHKAPPVLTVHLKRFTPMGRKLTNPVRYDDVLDMHPYMSEGQFGPMYRLYGVINHAGSGPNSGHYYAFVRSRSGKWHEMNDESVEQRSSALSNKSAYILFYVQQPGEKLREATKQHSNPPSVLTTPTLAEKAKAVNLQSDGEMEDVGIPTSIFTAPHSDIIVPPSASPLFSPERKHSDSEASPPDPQAEMLKRKISKLESGKVADTVECTETAIELKHTERRPQLDLVSVDTKERSTSKPSKEATKSERVVGIDPSSYKRKERDYDTFGSPEKKPRSSQTMFVANPFSDRHQYKDTLGGDIEQWPTNSSVVRRPGTIKNRMNKSKRSMM